MSDSGSRRERRSANERLRRLLSSAGWTGEKLARAVNAAGAEAGLHLYYDRTAVAHWLSGVRPRMPTPFLIAEVLSRQLGRPVSLSAIGFGDIEVSQPVVGHHRRRGPSLAAELVDLCVVDADPNRRDNLRSDLYRLAELVVPRAADLNFASNSTVKHSKAAGWPVGRARVSQIAAMTKWFAEADAAFGGGHARAAVATYLGVDVAPWLYTQCDDRRCPELWAATARLIYLCGFMCFDDQAHGAAQRYYSLALKFAAAAGDRITYAIVLRGMSVQAQSLGHNEHALRLARTAVDTGSNARPEVRAFLLGQACAAMASCGDRESARGGFRETRSLMEQAHGQTAIIGAYHAGELYYQYAIVLTAIEDRSSAVRALKVSLRHRPASERRARAITLARLAELQVGLGHLSEACATWQRFLDDYVYLRSGRADRALENMRQRLRHHQQHPVAKLLWHRLASIADDISRAC